MGAGRVAFPIARGGGAGYRVDSAPAPGHRGGNLMKLRALPTILLLGALGASAAARPALAQSQVQVYGVLDLFLTRIAAQGLPAAVRTDASGLLANRIGLKGGEQLGPGQRVNFLLESGLNSDDGTAADGARFWNRQAWVSIATPAGELRLGRQNTPQFYMTGKYDAYTGATQASGWNNLFGAAPRVDNAVGYFAPALGDWRLQVLAARGAAGGAAPVAQLAASQSLHLAAEYERAPVYLGANYQFVKTAGLTGAARRVSVGASRAVGPAWRVYGAAARETRADGSQDSRLVSISARRELSPAATLSFGWAGLRDRIAGPGHGNAAETSALLRYGLSTRTTLYGAVSRLTQTGRRAGFSLNGAAVVAPGAQIRSPVPGGTINGVQLGVTHLF